MTISAYGQEFAQKGLLDPRFHRLLIRAFEKRQQAEVAETLEIEQAAVSKMEKQTDMYLSTLRRFIAAMGGQLDIVARFPEGVVRITQFGNVDEGSPRARTSR